MGISSLASLLGRSALVVKEIKINESGPQYVHIVARKAGLVAFFLAMIGIDSTTTFDVYADRLDFSEGSLSGRIKSCMPLSSMSVVVGGFVKPFLGLIGGIFCIFPFGIVLMSAGVAGGSIGSVFLGILSMLGGGILIIRYILWKTLLIQVAASSGWSMCLCLKRSIIEGVEINKDTADTIIYIINELVMAQTAK